MTELSETAKRRLQNAAYLRVAFRHQGLPGAMFVTATSSTFNVSDDYVEYLYLPYSTDSTDSLGLSKIWGFTTETLIGAAFFYVWSWHDARQKYFDMPVAEADALALQWAKFTADNWPDKKERKQLQRAVKWFGWLIPLYGRIRWKWIGGKR